MRTVIKEYLRLAAQRRQHLYSDCTKAYLFQRLVNYHALEFAKPLSTRLVWNIVARWGKWGGVGKLAPQDLRRTAIRWALDEGLSYQQVQIGVLRRELRAVLDIPTMGITTGMGRRTSPCYGAQGRGTSSEVPMAQT